MAALAGGFALARMTAAPKTNKNIVRGAIYVPARAYNAPQMWKNYSGKIIRRDMGYARKININAFRVWASFEYWKEEPGNFKKAFDDFLGAAGENKIRILISLFENCGVPSTKENMWTTDPKKAFCVNSPHKDIAKDKKKWEEPRQFVKWFMKHYKDDKRLLAIEIYNEPRNVPKKKTKLSTMPLAISLFETAASLRGKVPLTVGTAMVREAELFLDLGLDVIQIHQNFPPDYKTIEDMIKKAMELGKKKNLPVWLTEWQRLRPGGSGWGLKKIPEKETRPDYFSLAAAVQKYEIGTFFWSLMVKKAYLPAQRAKGTINGLFWEDGAVYSLKDARAIAADPGLKLKERKKISKDFWK